MEEGPQLGCTESVALSPSQLGTLQRQQSLLRQRIVTETDFVRVYPEEFPEPIVRHRFAEFPAVRKPESSRCIRVWWPMPGNLQLR